MRDVVVFLLVTVILVAGCATPQAPSSQRPSSTEQPSPSSLNASSSPPSSVKPGNSSNKSSVLHTGVQNRFVVANYSLVAGDTLVLPGNVTLRFVADEEENATFLLDAEELTLSPGENVTVLNFTIRLDALARGAVTEARKGVADFSLSTDRGSVRDTLREGETKRYDRNATNATLTVTLSFLGKDENGHDVAQFTVDGVLLRPLAEKEDVFLGDGYLFLHYLYPARDGTVAVDEAKVTVTQNQYASSQYSFPVRR